MKDLEMYIDGQFIENRSGKWINVLNPSTEEVISRMPDGTVDDVPGLPSMRRRRRKEHGND